MKQILLKTFAASAVAVVLFASSAGAVTIAAVANPAGPFIVGDEFDINLSVSGWNAGDPEVDAVEFRVDFTGPVIFVAGSGFATDTGAEFLALANQGGTYNLFDDTDESFVGLGRFLFGAFDDTEGVFGSIGPAGELGGFRLKVTGLGTVTITPNSPAPNLVFSDPGLFGITPTGGVTFSGTSVNIVPEPSTFGLLALTGGLFFASRRRFQRAHRQPVPVVRPENQPTGTVIDFETASDGLRA